MPHKGVNWVSRLEAKYQEDWDTLIPRLLNRNGMKWVADEGGVSLGLVSRFCTEHGIERLITYKRIIEKGSAAIMTETLLCRSCGSVMRQFVQPALMPGRADLTLCDCPSALCPLYMQTFAVREYAALDLAPYLKRTASTQKAVTR